MLGVPGLVSAYRKGQVTLANAVGTGVADDKSVYPYVPDMIRFYLGEDPIIANVQTWRLENQEDLAYVLEHLQELVVKETQGSGGYGMLIGPTSTARERDAYKQRVLDAPHKFIAQPTLSLSTCPTFVETGCGATPHRPAALRAVGQGRRHGARRAHPRGAERGLAGGEFVAGRRDQGYVGGWMGTRSPATSNVAEPRITTMLSRTASNLFWMARYVERGENTARILDVTYRMSLMPQDPSVAQKEWFAPLNITGTLFPFSGRYSTVGSHDVLRYMVLDPDNPSSILSCARAARENARAVRGAITSEMWEVLNSTWLELQNFNESRLDSEGVSHFFDWVKERAHLFRGVTVGTALKDEAFPLQPAGHLPGARRQHRAHPGREIPRAPAERRGRGRGRGLLPVGCGAALGERVRVVPQGLP